MRTHPTSARLGYSLSWPHKFLPGRAYQDQTVEQGIAHQVASGRFFNHTLLQKWFLVSQTKRRSYAQGQHSLNVYLYSYKYLEIEELLGPHKKYFRLKRYLLQGYLSRYLDKIRCFYRRLHPSKVNFILVVNRFFRAELVSAYIIQQLVNRFKLPKIVPFLGKRLVFHQKNRGLLVQCSGRFDRKERASYSTYSYGRVSMGTFRNRVLYHRDQVTLKYGVCGIKVWLYKR